jgi:hypothetical protein
MKRLNIRVLILAVLGFAGLAVSTAGADIYAWTDENGVKYFTNHAPPKQATLFMKTPEIPYDEEADNQRREIDRLAVARQELAEREAFILEQQLAAERRLEAANARADEALREADRILQDANAAAEDANSSYSGSYGYGYYFPYYGDRYRIKHHYKHKVHHHKYKKGVKPHNRPPYDKSRWGKHRVGLHSIATHGWTKTHRSRTAAFLGKHGRRF